MTSKNGGRENKIRKASEVHSTQQQKIEAPPTFDLASPDIIGLQGVIGNQAVQRLLKKSTVRRPASEESRVEENTEEQNANEHSSLPILSPSPLVVARAPADAPPPGANLPTLDANAIPKSWRQSPVPSSGGQDVFLYRGLEKGAAQASSQIIRSADVAAGGFTSTDLPAAQDAVFNAYGRDPVLSGSNAGGVVRVKIPGAVWDQLVKSNNISQRSYGGFSGGMGTSELRINTQEAASLINGLPNDVIPPDPYYDRRPGAARASRPAPVPPFGAGSKPGGQAAEPAKEPGESVSSSERPTGRFRAVSPPAQSGESAPTEPTAPTSSSSAQEPVTSGSTSGVTPTAPPGFSPGTRAVAGGLGILVVVNEILGPIARVRNQQQHNIDEGNAQINFLRRFGANPKVGIWDQTERKPLPPDTTPSTSLFGSPSYPYVVDVDINAFRASLPRLINDYQSYVYFVSTAKELNLLDEDPEMPATPTKAQRAEERHYRLKVNMEERGNHRLYDITDTMMQVQSAVINKVDKTMRTQLQGLPANQQSNIFRLKQGSETPVYRSARGHQPILSSKQFFGPDPWVRPMGKKLETSWWQSFQHGQSEDRLLVVPANGDAERSSLVSAYWVHEPIEDVFDEVKDGGRPITDRQPEKGGPLNSFVAGPEPGSDSRFGETRYYRHNDPDVRWTVSIGELRQFWVDATDLEPVTPSQVSTYVNQDSPNGNQKPK